MWWPQVDLFPDAIAPDLPGFGGTEGVGQILTMAAAADRCVQALDYASVPRAVVCGLSMGGYVAFELWRTHPERVAGLVLANTRAEADDAAGREKRVALAKRLRSEGSGFLVEQPPPLLSGAAEEELRSWVSRVIADQPAEAIAAASAGMAERPDSTSTLATISVPTLVINSTGDALIPADITARIAEGVAGSRLATIGDVGHLSNLEAPDAFNALLREHLERSSQQG